MSEIVDRSRVFGERPEAVERIAPGHFEPGFVAEHVARYKWASRWVRGRVTVDVACGTGYGAPILRAAGARAVLSLDVSRDALRFGRPIYDLRAVCCYAEDLSMKSGSCGAAVSLETIEHLVNPRAFVRELSRILCRGGELLLSTPNVVRSHGNNPYHLHEMAFQEIRSVIQEAGFRIVGVWGQHCELPLRVLQRVRGLRWALYRIERMPMVTSWVRIGLVPFYWCVRAKKI